MTNIPATRSVERGFAKEVPPCHTCDDVTHADHGIRDAYFHPRKYRHPDQKADPIAGKSGENRRRSDRFKSERNHGIPSQFKLPYMGGPRLQHQLCRGIKQDANQNQVEGFASTLFRMVAD